MIETIRRDLRRGLKRPDTGRNGLTAQQVLRSLVLMRVKNWDFRELRERIADGYTLRRFTQFYCRLVPKHDAFNRAPLTGCPPDACHAEERDPYPSGEAASNFALLLIRVRVEGTEFVLEE